jgi:hypothetical protein
LDVRREQAGALTIGAPLDLRDTVSETVGSGHLARARLKNGETLPRFEEIYRFARGRTAPSIAPAFGRAGLLYPALAA